MSDEKARIVYFDLMKGVCIILVVIGHCYDKLGIMIENVHLWSMLEHLRMPLYFFLSGMFFKEYSSAIEFVVKKFNRLIVPFLFFAVMSVVPALFSGEIAYGVLPIKNHIIWMLKYAGYLWFLRTLFIANMLYYIYHKLMKHYNKYIQCGVICVLACIGWILNEYLPQEDVIRRDYGLIFSVVTSLLVFPFLFVASNIKNLLQSVETIKWNRILLMFVVSIILCYLTAEGGVYLMYAKVDNNPIKFYLASFAAITMVWCVCYSLRKYLLRGYVNYMGRYSIIVYLTHVPLLGALVYSGMIHNLWMLVVIMLSVMPMMIWVFKKSVPTLVAQRDVFIYDKGSIKVDLAFFR